MLLALALLSVVHVTPEASSARLISEPTAPAVEGLGRVWVPYAVAGAITSATALGFFIGIAAGGVGSIAAIGLIFVAAMIGGVAHLVGAIIGGAIASNNAAIRRKAADQLQPRAEAFAPTQPLAVVLRF